MVEEVDATCYWEARFPDPLSCHHFIFCTPAESVKALRYNCSQGTRYDPIRDVCAPAAIVPCSNWISICKHKANGSIAEHPHLSGVYVKCGDLNIHTCPTKNHRIIQGDCKFECPTDGFFPSGEEDGQKYYQCVHIAGRLFGYLKDCGYGRIFSLKDQFCVPKTSDVKTVLTKSTFNDDLMSFAVIQEQDIKDKDASYLSNVNFTNDVTTEKVVDPSIEWYYSVITNGTSYISSDIEANVTSDVTSDITDDVISEITTKDDIVSSVKMNEAIGSDLTTESIVTSVKMVSTVITDVSTKEATVSSIEVDYSIASDTTTKRNIISSFNAEIIPL